MLQSIPEVYRILDILGSSPCPEIDLPHPTALLALPVFCNEILLGFNSVLNNDLKITTCFDPRSHF